MERITPEETPSPALVEDRQMLMWMHLSQLLNMVTAVGGLIVPIILWQIKKDEIIDMDEQGKEVVNFQISILIYALVSAILIFVLIGIILLSVVAIINIVFPLINGIKARDGNPVHYPLTIQFIK